MRIQVGNLWDSKADLILVTTNAVVRNGELVMGAGAAKEAKLLYPNLPYLLGQEILGGTLYGLVVIEEDKIGAFQTKVQYKNSSTLDVIRFSTNALLKYLENKPTLKVAMNYPGIGYGGLKEEDVYPVISVLPDNVTVFKFA